MRSDDSLQIEHLFEPFVERNASADSREWRKQSWKRKRHTLVKLPGRWLSLNGRDAARIRAEYSKAWQTIPYASYSLDRPPPRFSPWEWRGQRMLASTFGATRVRQLLLIRILERVRPRRVLEVGCGNGIHLLLLAGRFPDVEFAGIELTAEGRAAAVGLQSLPELPAEMQAYAPEPLVDPSAFRRIDFRQGSADQLPFRDGAFDLVFTVLSLEQMERIRHAALGEISRVARRHAFMIEPFADVNEDFWSRLNVIRRNYFEGRVADLPRYGLHPVYATDDFPQESLLKVRAVLSEKRTPIR